MTANRSTAHHFASHAASVQPESPAPCDVLIIGAGPIGIACAIEAKRRDLRAVVIEKGCLVNSLFHYPTAMRFFSTPELLEIGGVPFITTGEKPTRLEALEYYRRVADAHDLTVRLYERVLEVEGSDGDFHIRTTKGDYRAAKVIAAIGYFDRPRLLGVPGESLDKVTHYFTEAHPYAGQRVLIVGSGNSAVEAALECYRHGVHVTMAIRGEAFHEGIKYWIRPDIENRIRDGDITAHFRTRVLEIKPESVLLQKSYEPAFEIGNDFVLAMTGYMPDYEFMRRLGIAIGDDPLQTPVHDPKTRATNRPGLYLAGVVVGGMDTKTWFIENSRAHAAAIFDDITASSHDILRNC